MNIADRNYHSPQVKPFEQRLLEVNINTVGNKILNVADMKETSEHTLVQQIYALAESIYPGSSKELIPAMEVSKEMHGDQTRSGNPEMSYFIHPLRVAKKYVQGYIYHQQDNLSHEEGRKRFINGIKIAVGHDLFEEGVLPWTKERIDAFGPDALTGIRKLTIYKHEKWPPEIQYFFLEDTFSIKIYDRIDNLLDFLELPLELRWGKEGQKKSVRERLVTNIAETKQYLLVEAAKRNPFLMFLLERVIIQVEKRLKEEPQSQQQSLRRQAS